MQGVLGMRSTDDFVSGERPLMWRLGISELYPNAIPLMTLITRVGKRKATDPEFNWFERSYPTRELVVTVGDVPDAQTAAAADTCECIAYAYNVRKNHVIMNTRTLERVLVTADPTGADDIAIKRGMGSTGTQATWLVDDVLQVIGTAHEEGQSVPTAISYDVSKQNNYCQIFRNSTSSTRTALKTRLRTKALRQRAQREALLLHETEKEWAALFGQSWEDTSGDEVKRGTGGMVEFATTHIKNFAGSVTLNGWRSFVYDVFEDGSDEKLLLAGNLLMESLEAMFDAHSVHLRDVPETDTFGMTMKSWRGAGGTLYIVEEKLLTKSATFNDWGFVVDPDRIQYNYVDDTEWLPNRQAPGDDRNIGEYLGEIGFEWLNADSTMGIIKNATAYAGA